MATKDDLQNAFAGESQANRRYLAFAKKAEAEGYPQVAKVFRAAAQGETVHAHAHLRAMGGIKSTQENLEAALKGESFEFKQMYPGYIEQARAENNKAALGSFQNAMAVEQVHYSLYNEALKAVQAGQDLTPAKVFVCSVCGNTVLNEPPEKCPVCGAPKDKFSEIE
ncbi:MAG: rubrerythrin family protein [Planctomycetota bacterium]|jgi:rubrerythrin